MLTTISMIFNAINWMRITSAEYADTHASWIAASLDRVDMPIRVMHCTGALSHQLIPDT